MNAYLCKILLMACGNDVSIVGFLRNVILTNTALHLFIIQILNVPYCHAQSGYVTGL